ncbi:MAG: hypothetical protein N2314_08285 [Brevinematales bacterium]|nr:hypothetical protein [Brevinematales bacterium]
MKRILSMVIIISMIGLSACGKKETKPEEKPPSPTPEQKPTVTTPKEDLSFETVMKTLREALERERRESNSATRIQTAKAYILLVKFLQTDKEKVRKAGMTDADVSFLISDAKTKARQRLEEVVKNPTASPEAKQEAEKLLSSL